MLMRNTDAVMQDQDRYVMICGQGRSGTNWLLDILDQSPRTHCRNEPNEIAASPLAKLPIPSVLGGDTAALARNWDSAVDWTSKHIGERDHALPGPKDHIWPVSRVLGLSRAMNRRPRRIVGTVFRSLRQGEWDLPRWIGSRGRLGKALPVLKFVQAPMWAAW